MPDLMMLDRAGALGATAAFLVLVMLLPPRRVRRANGVRGLPGSGALREQVRR